MSSERVNVSTNVLVIRKPAKLAIVKLGVDLGIFNALAKEEDVDLAALAASSGAEPSLMCKSLQPLTRAAETD